MKNYMKYLGEQTMRLTQISIENFGIYQGMNTYAFPYSHDKKVSLIIGKNGAGKTTFLNAVKTCFFGSMILRNRNSTKSYADFILNKLNINALKNEESNFSVEITFVSHLHKFDGCFNIKRSWSLNHGSLKETVVIKRNAKVLTTHEQDEFFNVMFHAYPLDLFDLFYLDGEKIDQLSVLNTNLIEMIESSINIDLFKSLKTDLATYAIRRANSKHLQNLEHDKKNSQVQLKEYQIELENRYVEQTILENQIVTTRSSLSQLKKNLNLATLKIDNVAINVLNTKIAEKKHEIQELLTSYLPYAFLKEQLNKITSAIDLEESSKMSQTIQNALTKDLEKYIINALGAENEPKITGTIDSIRNYYAIGDQKFIHRLNNEDFYNLKNKITGLINGSQHELKVKMQELNTLEEAVQTLTQELETYNLAEKAGYLDDLLALQSELGKNELELDQTLAKINDTLLNIDKRKKNLDDLDKEIWKELKKTKVNDVLDQLNGVLEKYIATIKEEKIKVIEAETKNMFERLIRKQGFIKNFRIKNQLIYLLDQNNNQLNHSHLSAGEKQLFILSIIYAIIQSSERKVPMIFDTLLSRLDKGHRNNVFKEFIGSSTDQVIILATDSELENVDQAFLDTIINVTYTIDYSKLDHQLIEMS